MLSRPIDPLGHYQTDASQVLADKAKAIEHINFLHRNSKGYIFIGHEPKKSNATWKQAGYKLASLKRTQPFLPIDCYLSPNTFNTKNSRAIENLNELNANYIDLDFGLFNANSDYVFEHVLSILRSKAEIPQPHFVLFSGRGAHLYWLLANEKASELPLWQVVQDTMIDIFKDSNVDAQVRDASRVLRLAGTFNSKNDKHYTEISVIHDSKPYTLKELNKGLIEYIGTPAPDRHQQTRSKEEKKSHSPESEKKKRTSKVTSLLNRYTLHYERIHDIGKLVELRKASKRYAAKGKRELTLFIFRSAYKAYTDEQQALDATLELNMQFAMPLSRREAEKATASANRSYRMTNAYIIRALDISPEEQRHMKTIIGKEEKYRRKNEKRNKTRRHEYLRQATVRRSEANRLREAGHTNKEIAELLSIETRHVRRLIER